jgi:hypothetical protein
MYKMSHSLARERAQNAEKTLRIKMEAAILWKDDVFFVQSNTIRCQNNKV